jgi:RNA polymerase sigma factor (sigma-70 family)
VSGADDTCDIRRSSYLFGVARVSTSDLEKVLDVVYEAAEVDGPRPFPEPVLEAMRRLVPCDVVAFHDRTGGEPAVSQVGEPRAPVTTEIRAAARRHWYECPLTPMRGARKYSDVLTRREFHALGLYQECARPLGIEDVFRVWLGPGADGACIEFDRAQRSFTERDRGVLDILGRHLEQVWRRAARRSVLADRSDRLTPREREILELVAEGRTNAELARLLWISPATVRKHLENAYEKLDVHTRTGAVAALRNSTALLDE